MLDMNADRWFAVVGVVIGVSGILLTIWVYRRGEKRRVPTVVASPSRVVLVHPGASLFGGISATHNGKPIGNDGITAIAVYFWNDGQLPILTFGNNLSLFNLSPRKGANS